MNILCVIPARGKSKRLKNKNILLLNAKPVITYTIEAALDSKLVNHIVVSTDDSKISLIAKQCGVETVKRPTKYSTDMAPIEEALRHALKSFEIKTGIVVDILVCLQANVPVRKKGQIDKVIRKLMSSRADSAVTVSPVRQYPLWMKKMSRNGLLTPLFPKVKKYRFQDVEPLYLLDGAVVAVRRNTLMGTEGMSGAHVFLGKTVIGVVQSREYAIEIDHREDLVESEFYLKKLKSQR